MHFEHRIVKWNCRCLKPSCDEVSLLVSECNPSVFCFQETFQRSDDNILLRGLNVFSCVHAGCLGPSGDASVFVK